MLNNFPLDEFNKELIPDAQAEWVSWQDRRLKRITRLRLVSDPGHPYWDCSYIYGQLRNGDPVHVHNPFLPGELTKRTLRNDIIQAARHDGVYAKGLGVFEALALLC